MKKIRLYNSLGNQYEDFVPLKEGEVSIYVCGPTVYDDPHIGNFRPVIVFDTWRRLFLSLGYKVTFVSNYTDVDDKIINRAKQLGITEKELTEGVIASFRELVDKVGAFQPDITPMPTVYMEKMINYIDDLVKDDKAYQSGGDVYFSVENIQDYGCLSGNTVESLNSGARIEVNSAKRNPTDFALWKHTEEGIRWDSPWGAGRPGWHTECCVMIASIFKDQGGYIDIHGGGFDLKFPHHENEIAQSEAHNHNHLAKYWLHNGFINIDNEKMSKSLGNVMLAKDFVGKYGGMAFRLMVLNAHYRAPLSFTEETITEASKNLVRMEMAYRQGAVALQMAGMDVDSLHCDKTGVFYDELCNDLNTPNALTELYAEIKKLNQILRTRPLDIEMLKESMGKLNDYFYTLGLQINYPHMDEDSKKLYQEYLDAKAAKDFARSDLLRPQLMEKGII